MLQTDFQSDGITHKQNETAFLIDRSPEYFEHILNYLRYKKIYLKEFDSKEVFLIFLNSPGNY
jgi:hypothetical protein